MEKQVKLEKAIIAEAKMAEKEYLKGLKEKDYNEHVSMKKLINEHVVNEDKAFMSTVIEKEGRNIEEWKNREALKKNIVREELSGQIVQRKRMSESERRAKLEEVG